MRLLPYSFLQKRQTNTGRRLLTPQVVSGGIKKRLTSTNGRTIKIDMTKGEDTKRFILETGLDMASRLGLENVTIGELAKATDMSKSGLFAHFKSKENLQIEILHFAGELFSEGVIVPTLREKAGIERIRKLVDNWISWTGRLTGGCIFVTASTDFSSRPGKVRDALLEQQAQWLSSLKRFCKSSIRAGDLRDGIDCDQFAFDLYSLLLGFHLYQELLQDKETRNYQETALSRLLEDYM
jgi:AcrR family transcriptional regulator